MRHAGVRCCIVAAAGLAVVGMRLPVARAAITIVQNSSTNWTVSNGALTIVYDPAGSKLTSVKIGASSTNILDPGNAQLYVESAGNGLGAGTTTSTFQQDAAKSYIDLFTTTQSNATNGYTYSTHFVLFNNDPAIHTYQVFNHSATDVAASSGQGQFLMRVDSNLFGTLYQNNLGPNYTAPKITNMPTASQLSSAYADANRLDQKETLDLTGLTALQTQLGHTYLTKYDYSSYEQFHTGQTEYGSQFAVSSLLPSHETLIGGPTKQNLMFTNNILMVEFMSGHYGSGYGYTPAQGVDSSRLWGPFVFRAVNTNGETGAQLYADAVNSLPAYTAKYDTEATLLASGYVPSTARSNLHAAITSTVGWSADTTNNTIVLSDQNENFQKSSNGYQYWAQIGSNGTADFSGVIPGTYRASIYQYGQWGESRFDGVPVKNGQLTLPQNFKFKPENFSAAAPIWTIGTPDRSAHEFTNGHAPGDSTNTDVREYQGWYNYWQQLAPNNGKVVYYGTAVGATPATNDTNQWLQNQWHTFNPAMYDTTNDTSDNYAAHLAPAYVTAAGGAAAYHGAPWEVHFTTTAAQSAQGRYVVLSVAAAATEADLFATLNGHQLIWHAGNRSDPMQRQGDAGYYQWVAFQWDNVAGNLLNAPGADNVLTLDVNEDWGLMYDALRLEITPTSANPSTTGWFDYEYITGSGNNAADSNDAAGQAAVVTFTPEPASLALMACGSLLLLARRHRPRRC